MLNNQAIRIFRVMSSSICSVLTVVVLSALVTIPALAQTTVRFTLDTSTYPIEADDVVMLCGSGATLGEWEVYRHIMVPSPDNQKIYQVEVPFAEEEIGSTISYKYVVVKPGDIQYWEEVASRSLEVPSEAVNLDPAFFENRASIGVTQSVMPVTIAIDLNQWEDFDDQLDGIGIKSSLHPLPLTLREESDPQPLSDEDGDGIWTTQFNVLYGSPREFSFTLYYLDQEVWNIHMLYGKLEHVALLPEQASDGVTISLAFSPQTGGYVSNSPPRYFVNNYTGIYRALGEWGKGTRFQYFVAMDQLQQGKPQQARRAYEAYQVDRNTDWDTRDDFDYMWIQHLGKTQGTAQAEAYARQAGQGKYEYLRRSLLAKAAEVSYMQDDFQRSKRLVRHLHQNPQFQDQLTWNEYFSRQLLAMSYLQDGHEDSTAVGMQLMELAANDSSDRYWRRNALWQQVYSHTDAGNREGAVAAFEKLATTGRPGQRIAARQRLADFYLRQGDPAQAEATLEQVETELASQQSNPSYRNWWMRQQLKRARFQIQVGDRTRARQILQEARNAAQPRQARRLDRALERMDRTRQESSNGRGNQ